ncbi:maleylpyruvate isomerase N-terminal domain-containing protein [Gordonia sp. C13]|uniref:maleylpyruvate isomerase N-terminal domain-containing protein n=1 Tax=Gordonia sp. C13 TaxID=2935078 RepID=UPI0035A8C73A
MSAALALVDGVVGEIGGGDYARPTPCAGWDVRAVLNHVVATTAKFSQYALGHTTSPRTVHDDVLGTDPRASFRAATKASTIAWENDVRLESKRSVPSAVWCVHRG